MKIDRLHLVIGHKMSGQPSENESQKNVPIPDVKMSHSLHENGSNVWNE